METYELVDFQTLYEKDLSKIIKYYNFIFENATLCKSVDYDITKNLLDYNFDVVVSSLELICNVIEENQNLLDENN